MIALVIFDCDGVLVDTEPVANRVLQHELAAVGFEMRLEEVVRIFVGRSRDDCIRIAGELRGVPLPAEFGPRWDAAFDEALRRDVKPIDGVPELLDRLTLPYCVASNGEPDRMRLALTAAGLLAKVDGRLFTASDVARPKPAPDLYLHAAKAMGFAPASTAVIEDTVTGATAAKAAGMRVLGYVGGEHSDAPGLAALGAEVIHSMRDVPARLGLP